MIYIGLISNLWVKCKKKKNHFK